MIVSIKSGIIFVIDAIGCLLHLDSLFKQILNMSIIIIIIIVAVFTTDINFEAALSYI